MRSARFMWRYSAQRSGSSGRLCMSAPEARRERGGDRKPEKMPAGAAPVSFPAGTAGFRPTCGPVTGFRLR